MREFGKVSKEKNPWYKVVYSFVKVFFMGVADFKNGYSERNAKRQRKTKFDKYQPPRY